MVKSLAWIRKALQTSSMWQQVGLKSQTYSTVWSMTARDRPFWIPKDSMVLWLISKKLVHLSLHSLSKDTCPILFITVQLKLYMKVAMLCASLTQNQAIMTTGYAVHTYDWCFIHEGECWHRCLQKMDQGIWDSGAFIKYDPDRWDSLWMHPTLN